MSLRAILLTLAVLTAQRASFAWGSSDDDCSTATPVTAGTYTGLQTSGSWSFPNTITFDTDWFRFTALPLQTVDVDATITMTSGHITAGSYTFMVAYEYSPTSCSGAQIATSFVNHVSVTNATSLPKEYVLRYYAGVNTSGDHVLVTYNLSLQASHLGVDFCAGDNTGTACPCGNSGSAQRGCANSVFTFGAQLVATGTASTTTGLDTLTLNATELPGPALFFQGDVRAAGGLGFTFGDGLLCAGGTIARLCVAFPTGGTASYPDGLTQPPVHVAGSTAAGDVRSYQCWYRDAAAYCTSATYNLTQGVTLTWLP